MKEWAGVAQSTVGHGLLSGRDLVPFPLGYVSWSIEMVAYSKAENARSLPPFTHLHGLVCLHSNELKKRKISQKESYRRNISR